MTNSVSSSQSSGSLTSTTVASSTPQRQLTASEVASTLGLSSSSAVSTTALALFSQQPATPQIVLTDRVTQMLATTTLEETPSAPSDVLAWGSKALDLPQELQNLSVSYISPEELDDYINEFLKKIPTSTPDEATISLIDLLVKHNKAYQTERLLNLQKNLESLKNTPVWRQSVIFIGANGTSTEAKPLPILFPTPPKTKIITDLPSFLNRCPCSESVIKRITSISDQAALVSYFKTAFHTEESSIHARIAAAFYFHDTERLQGYFRQHTPQTRLELIDAMTTYFGTEAEEYLINCAFSIAPLLFQPIVPVATQEQLDSLEKNLVSIYETYCTQRTEETDKNFHDFVSRIVNSDSRELRNCAVHLLLSLQKAISNTPDHDTLNIIILRSINQLSELQKLSLNEFASGFFDMYYKTFFNYQTPLLSDIARFLRDGLKLKMAAKGARSLYALAAYEVVNATKLMSKVDYIKEKILTKFSDFILSSKEAQTFLKLCIDTIWHDGNINQKERYEKITNLLHSRVPLKPEKNLSIDSFQDEIEKQCEKLKYRRHLTERGVLFSTNQILKILIALGFLQ